ncbi:MAG: hypothetical protein ABSC94_25525, partial [Polyangiaceae bacterium]
FTILWLFNTASALAGALQVYFPGRFQPAVSTVLDDRMLEGLVITLANGTNILRPMGLTDTPAGACIGALFSVLLGVGFLLGRPKLRLKLLVLAAMAISLFTLYLTQVRSVLMMLIISLLAMSFALVIQRRSAAATAVLGTISGLAVLGFTLALSIGGTAVGDRFSTLIAEDPRTVYYDNRGHFVEDTFVDLLPQYPFGAGLGRWGMIHTYFGSRGSRIDALWAELQWTAWLYDGGFLLMLIYGSAVVWAIWLTYRVATRADSLGGELQTWATVLFGYGIGVFAITFNACPFESNGGLEFWLLSASVYVASQQSMARAVAKADNL